MDQNAYLSQGMKMEMIQYMKQSHIKNAIISYNHASIHITITISSMTDNKSNFQAFILCMQVMQQ